MRDAHPIERAVGIDHYVSDAPGVGGELRESPADFRVRELEAVDVEGLDADSGGYQHLVVRATLRGWDTNDFASALSDRLGISRERVSWAGTKDKHAVTTQLFSIDGIDADDLPDVPNADVEAVGRTGRPVLFGDLAGNAFALTLRTVTDPDGVGAVTEDLHAFAGVGADGDHVVPGVPDDGEGQAALAFGASLAAGDDAGADGAGDDAATPPADVGSGAGTTVAVPNFFGQQRFGSRRPVTHEVGLAIARGDWEGGVLAYVGNPGEREPEATREARAYVDETRDWQGAIDRFPRALGFERAICHRLVENGADEPGDFRDALEALPENLQSLLVNAAQSYVFNRILSTRMERGLPFDRPVAGDVVCFADADAPAGLALPDADRTQRVTADRVDTVERHCERGRAFVTAPLVGTETELGDGEPGDIERAVLDDVGIAPGDFDRPGQFGSTGTRRAIQVRTGLATERVDDDAVRFAFALPKGSYATVLLREYVKGDPEDL